MGIGLIVAGLAFLFVPSVSVYDFMPDFIGYMLILGGLRKISPLDGNLQSARSNFIKLCVFNLIKTALIIPLLSLNDETTVMLVTFSFAIIETIFLWSAAGELMEGINYLSSRAGSKAADRDYSGNLLLFRVFIIARAVLVSIPELVVMTGDDYQSGVDIQTNSLGALYAYRQLILVACVAVSAVIGTVFIVKLSVYLLGIKRDGLTVPYLAGRYESEILANEGRRIYTALKRGLSLMAAGMFFLTAFEYRGVDVLPDFLGIILIAVGFLSMAKHISVCRGYAGATFGAAVVSAGAYALKLYVSTEYYHASTVKTDKAVLFYTLSACADAVSYAAFAAVLVCVCLCMYKIIRLHMAPPSFRAEAFVRSTENKAAALCVCGLLCCVLGCAASFLYIYNEAFWLAGAAVWLIFAIAFLRVTDNISDEVEKKYM